MKNSLYLLLFVFNFTALPFASAQDEPKKFVDKPAKLLVCNFEMINCNNPEWEGVGWGMIMLEGEYEVLPLRPWGKDNVEISIMSGKLRAERIILVSNQDRKWPVFTSKKFLTSGHIGEHLGRRVFFLTKKTDL